MEKRGKKGKIWIKLATIQSRYIKMKMPLAAKQNREKNARKTGQKGSGKKEEGSNVLRRVDHNSRRQLMEMLSVGALAASSSSRMLRFDSLARKLKLASARPLGAPYVGPGLRQPSRASRERERERERKREIASERARECQ